MNFAHWALSIGQKPRPLIRDGLACPAVHLGPRLSEVWDSELGGTVFFPSPPIKAAAQAVQRNDS
jgi:hypothetical protein